VDDLPGHGHGHAGGASATRVSWDGSMGWGTVRQYSGIFEPVDTFLLPWFGAEIAFPWICFLPFCSPCAAKDRIVDGFGPEETV
jgi:hypothetical protein